MWTVIPSLLLDRQVHGRRLLVAGAASAAAMTTFSVGTPILMPDLMTSYATS